MILLQRLSFSFRPFDDVNDANDEKNEPQHKSVLADTEENRQFNADIKRGKP